MPNRDANRALVSNPYDTTQAGSDPDNVADDLLIRAAVTLPFEPIRVRDMTGSLTFPS